MYLSDPILLMQIQVKQRNILILEMKIQFLKPINHGG